MGYRKFAKLWYESHVPVVRWLCFLQIALWCGMLVLQLADESLHARVVTWVALNPATFGLRNLWALAVYPFLHAGPDLIGMIVDVVMLSIFGGMFGRRWRRQTHFFFFWMASALFAGGVHLAAGSLAPGLFGAPALGSQGPVMAFLGAFLLVFGEAQSRVIGIEKPVKGKWVVYVVLGLQSLFFLFERNPLLALELGGFLAGWLMVSGRWRPKKFTAWARRLGTRFRAWRRGFRSLTPLFSLHGPTAVGTSSKLMVEDASMAPRVLLISACCSLFLLQACAKEAPEETATQVMKELAVEMATNDKADSDLLGVTEKICQKYKISVEEFSAFLANHKEAQESLAKYILDEAVRAVADPSGKHAQELNELEEKVGKTEKELGEAETALQEKTKKELEQLQLDNDKKKKEVEAEIEQLKSALKKGSQS